MNVTEESQVEEHLLDQFGAVADEGRQLIGRGGCNDPKELIESINEFLSKPTKKKWFKKVDNWTEKALPIGTLWGEVFVKELGWEWINVTFEDGSQSVGVFSRDRSIGFYPWHFVLGCVENGATVTVLLAWNMLKEGAVPKTAPNSYVNLMDGVHHIIPPE